MSHQNPSPNMVAPVGESAGSSGGLPASPLVVIHAHEMFQPTVYPPPPPDQQAAFPYTLTQSLKYPQPRQISRAQFQREQFQQEQIHQQHKLQQLLQRNLQFRMQQLFALEQNLVENPSLYEQKGEYKPFSRLPAQVSAHSVPGSDSATLLNNPPITSVLQSASGESEKNALTSDTLSQARAYNQGYMPNGAAGGHPNLGQPAPGAVPLLPNQGRVVQSGPIRVLCIADVRGRNGHES